MADSKSPSTSTGAFGISARDARRLSGEVAEMATAPLTAAAVMWSMPATAMALWAQWMPKL